MLYKHTVSKQLSPDLSMLKSMTAYGRAEKRASIGTVTAEIQTFNRKFLDIAVSLPNEFSSLDVFVRNRVSSGIKRGKINVKIFTEYTEETPFAVKPNIPLVRQIKEAWENIEKEVHVVSEVDLKVVVQMPGVFQFAVKREKEGEWKALIAEAVDGALLKAQEMRINEGEAIFFDFTKRLECLRKYMNNIKSLSPQVIERNRKKIHQTLLEIMGEGEDLEERLLKEVCIFSEKADIEEEITRFFSHLEQFNRKMEISEESIGKTLEFLLQEMQREVNTIGSKAQDLRISGLVVEMKTEIERIREQVQNVE